MISQIVKQLIILISLLILLSSQIVMADSRKASEDEIKLSQTIHQFFTDWLIKCDVEAAMKYVSSKAVICKGIKEGLPDEFKSKDNLSQEDINKIFKNIVTLALNYTQQSDNLETCINSKDLGLDSNDTIVIQHPERNLFELFLLNIVEGKTAKDFAFICKFDETPSFREAVGQPNSYYVMTNIKFKPKHSSETYPDKFPFEMVWIKESNVWRILTIASIED